MVWLWCRAVGEGVREQEELGDSRKEKEELSVFVPDRGGEGESDVVGVRDSTGE